MRPRLIPPVAALLVTMVISTSACSDLPASAAQAPNSTPSGGSTSTSEVTPRDAAPRRAEDLDPEHYVRDYVSTVLGVPGRHGPIQATTELAASPQPPDGGVGGPPIDWPTINDDNVFVDHGDSLWTRVTTDAESTFGLDVDTGSYRLARVFLDNGQRPAPASVRPEEWINAFDYADRPSLDGLGLTVETGKVPHTADGTVLVRLGVSTPDLGAQRPPANITFVIDTSGSMDIGDRLGLVKASLALLVQHLADDDTIAIVEYGSEARQLLGPTPVTETARIIDVIDHMVAMGSTNMEAGLTLGYEAAGRAATPGSLNVVVLASDGVANVGNTDSGILARIATEGDAGIHLVTVGFGMGNYNDDLMEQLADRGDGFYRYVNTFLEARRLFVDELTPTLTVAARDAKVQVRFDPAKVVEYRLIGYENRMLDDEQFDDSTVDAGELGFGHRVSALYEVRMAADPGTGPIGTVALRWKTPDGVDAPTRTQPLTISADAASPTLRLAATVAATAEVLRNNIAQSDRGVTLSMLLADATALADAHVEGSGELLEVLRLAEVAAPAPNETTTQP